MTFPAANNGMSSYMTHYHRKKYVGLAYPLFDDDKSIDFWYGPKVLYGRVDQNNRPITLLPGSLTNIQESPDIFVINFVADAYEDFRQYINEAISKRKIDYQNSWIKAMRPYKGYMDSATKQQELLEILHNNFAIEFFNQSDEFKSVSNIHEYIDMFFAFYKRLGNRFPISLTSLSKTNLVSPLSTGLVLDLSDARHDLDIIKYRVFIEDRNFRFYQNAARKFGFKLDINAPWRIVADIASKEMLEYMKRYEHNSYQEMFSALYGDTPSQDIMVFKDFIFNSYNRFVEKFPFSKHTKVAKSGQRLKSCFTNRSNISREQYNLMFDTTYWLKFYFNVRAIELERRWTPAAYAKIGRYIEKVEKSLDTRAALRYIDEELLA